jgi:hypothetical protein
LALTVLKPKITAPTRVKVGAIQPPAWKAGFLQEDNNETRRRIGKYVIFFIV